MLYLLRCLVCLLKGHRWQNRWIIDGYVIQSCSCCDELKVFKEIEK